MDMRAVSRCGVTQRRINDTGVEIGMISSLLSRWSRCFDSCLIYQGVFVQSKMLKITSSFR